MPVDGHILGQKLPITFSAFEKLLQNYNVKYLVVWSESFKEFLSNLTRSINPRFALVKVIGRFSIFEYQGLSSSYIIQNEDILELKY
jgi:hypothetical protein